MHRDYRSGIVLAALALMASLSLLDRTGGQDVPPAEPAATEPASEPQPEAAAQPDAVPAESSVDPAVSPEQQRGPTDVKELEAFVDGIMEAQLTDKHIAGATFAFVVDGKPFFAKGYGHADVEARNRSIRPPRCFASARFRSCSPGRP